MLLMQSDYRIAKDALLQQASAFAASLAEQENQTKGATVRRVPVLADSLVGSRMVSVFTKSGEAVEQPEEVKVYVLEFGPDAGYAFFGGDKRASGLLGFAESGSFDPDTDNPGMQLMYEYMQDYVAAEIDRMESQRGDSLYRAVADKFPRVSDVSTKNLLDPLDPLNPDDPGGPYPPGHPLGPPVDNMVTEEQ